MTQTQNRLFDEIGKLFTNAAGAAQGVRSEVQTLIRSQMERLVSELDLVTREEFEAVREMAQLAREENEQLKARIARLEGGQTLQDGEAIQNRTGTKPRKPRSRKPGSRAESEAGSE